MPITPTVLLSSAQASQKQVKTRCPFIGIDNPEGGTPIVNFNVEQKLILDGAAAASLPATPGNIKRLFEGALLAETVTITDPVSGQDVTLSAAAIAVALQEFFCRWYAEDTAPTADPTA